MILGIQRVRWGLWLPVLYTLNWDKKTQNILQVLRHHTLIPSLQMDPLHCHSAMYDYKTTMATTCKWHQQFPLLYWRTSPTYVTTCHWEASPCWTKTYISLLYLHIGFRYSCCLHASFCVVSDCVQRLFSSCHLHVAFSILFPFGLVLVIFHFAIVIKSVSFEHLHCMNHIFFDKNFRLCCDMSVASAAHTL